MKSIIFVLLCITSIYSQDSLFTKTGGTISGDIIELSDSTLHFRREGFPGIQKVKLDFVSRLVSRDGTLLYDSKVEVDNIMSVSDIASEDTTITTTPSPDSSVIAKYSSYQSIDERQTLALESLAESNNQIAQILMIELGITVGFILIGVIIAL